MKIFITAGNTQAPIDRVRCLTNIFTGRTGAGIALFASRRRHEVCLATSHPEAISDLAGEHLPLESANWACLTYRTFEELQALMAERISTGRFDAVIHCAAVSDYLSGGVYAPAPGTHFDPTKATWSGPAGSDPMVLDRAAGKVKSDEPELWLRLVCAPKLVDRIRTDWSFRGVLVKFKLEVGISDEQLLDIAEKSRRQSNADLMVANTLEGASTWAFLGPRISPSPLGGKVVGDEDADGTGSYDKVPRRDLPARLLGAVESLHREKTHG